MTDEEMPPLPPEVEEALSRVTEDQSPGDSAYRRAERLAEDYGDAFWGWLEKHKYDDPTICIGWATERAKRYLNRDQASVAAHTGLFNKQSGVMDEPISKSYILAMLSGRSKPTAQTYGRLADACEVNPIDFYIAEGWVNSGHLTAYSINERHVVLPVLTKLFELPPARRAKAIAVVLAVLDSIAEITEADLVTAGKS